ASAPRDHSLGRFAERTSVVFWKILAAVGLVSAQDEKAALPGGMLHCRPPRFAVIPPWRAINFKPLRVHEGGQQRHVVLPRQQMTAPRRRSGVSNTGKVEPSP